MSLTNRTFPGPTEEPDAEIGALRSTVNDLRAYLVCNSLEDCYDPLSKLGIDTVDGAIQAMKSPDPLTIQKDGSSSTFNIWKPIMGDICGKSFVRLT